MALFAARAIVEGERDTRSTPVRLVTGAITGSAATIVCLASLGGALGAPAVIALGLFALLTARHA
jgi:hypothetical protein